MDLSTDVLVVGAGPVGLVLAGDIGWRGHRCIVVERGDGSIYQPKMDMVGIRTMEFCRRWGIVADVEASPYARDYPQDNVYLTSLTGYELGREPMPSMAADRPPLESPQKRERCPQNMFDPILRRFAESQKGVQLLYEHEFLSLIDNADGVVASVKDPSTGKSITIQSRFLVGCDGAKSTVREQLGIAMQGRGVLTYTTNVIFRCAEFNALHDKKPGYRYMFVGPEGVWATIVAINGRDQWRMSIIGNASERRAYSDAELKDLACKALGRQFDPQILSILPWVRSELVAERYHRGRVFLCGDACHLTSPTGGLGMNTGIGDAVDLSWKLGAMLEGWGGPALAESYGIERKPVAERITRFSTGNLETMLSARSSEQLYEESDAGRAIRARVGHALGENMKREWFCQNMHLGYRYTGSPVCLYPELESPERIAAEYADGCNFVPSSRPGCRAPHAWLPDARSTLDLFGRGFVLLVFGGEIPAAGGQAARASGVPLEIVRVEDAPIGALYERRYVLVRPDGHVAWRGDILAHDAHSLIDVISGKATRHETVPV